MTAYYNEFDPFAAAWLRELIKVGLIADGEVDERSIVDVEAKDLKGFTQCHFFAGIGGWSYALRLAMWPDDRPVWTGSCPCQPFSTAGKSTRQSDERHLWPHWYRLIRESKPSVIFGEQVASAITAGWWDDVAADLETENYACAAAVLPACSVGAPHKRDRLWFVGYSEHDGHAATTQRGGEEPPIQHNPQGQNSTGQSSGAGAAGHVANAKRIGQQRQGAMGESISSTSSGDWETNRAFYDSAGMQWLECPDGKARPVEPGICLLAHGVSNRVGKLRGYGNAIVPTVAAEFIKAARECIA